LEIQYFEGDFIILEKYNGFNKGFGTMRAIAAENPAAKKAEPPVRKFGFVRSVKLPRRLDHT